MSKVVREPIQVYLTPSEREELERAAGALGVSRSEVLRRGIRTIGAPGFAGSLRDLADDGYVTAPMRGPGGPPPAAPVAPLSSLLAELDEDRHER
jgi:Ribbon-helix-helix protein, copG family